MQIEKSFNKENFFWYNFNMIIKSLKLLGKKDANTFVAVTDVGEYKLFSDVIVKYSISVGEADEERFKKAVVESNEKIAFNMAVKYASSKLKTEKQMRDYLYKKEFKKQTIVPVIDKLKEYGVIDDYTYAESYIKSNPNFSKNKLKQKLLGVGIDKELIENLLNDIEEDDSCLTNAKKFLKNKVLNKLTREKLIRRLSYLGYSWDSINSALHEFTFDDVDE